MATSAITPTNAEPARGGPDPSAGRFSSGQECSPYAGRVGSFADGQYLGGVAPAHPGRFSTGQEMTRR